MSVVTEKVARKRGARLFATCYRCGQRKEVRVPKPGVYCAECQTSDSAFGILTDLVAPQRKSDIDWGQVIRDDYEWIQAKRKGL